MQYLFLYPRPCNDTGSTVVYNYLKFKVEKKKNTESMFVYVSDTTDVSYKWLPIIFEGEFLMRVHNIPDEWKRAGLNVIGSIPLPSRAKRQ